MDGMGWLSPFDGLLRAPTVLITQNSTKEAEGDADEQEGKQGYLAARQCLRCHKALALFRAEQYMYGLQSNP